MMFPFVRRSRYEALRKDCCKWQLAATKNAISARAAEKKLDEACAVLRRTLVELYHAAGSESVLEDA